MKGTGENMAVKGKEKHVLYLTRGNVEIINGYLDSRKGSGGISGLVDEYIDYVSMTLESSGLTRGIKLPLPELLKLGI